MRIKMIPDMEKGIILKRSMLVSITDASFLVNDYMRTGYANGILSGCQLTTTKDTISLNKGLILFEGEIFMIKNPMTIAYKPTNTTMVMKLCFSNEMRDADCIYREADIILTEQIKPQTGELELCRFKLQEGAKLRWEYQSFEDMNTEFDTLNLIYAPYAAAFQSTLSPQVTKYFAREMLQLSTISEFDALFCIQILGQTEPVTKEALQKYLEWKKEEPLRESSNIELYRELVKILNLAKGTTKPESVKKKKTWKVMVD